MKKCFRYSFLFLIPLFLLDLLGCCNFEVDLFQIIIIVNYLGCSKSSLLRTVQNKHKWLKSDWKVKEWREKWKNFEKWGKVLQDEYLGWETALLCTKRELVTTDENFYRNHNWTVSSADQLDFTRMLWQKCFVWILCSHREGQVEVWRAAGCTEGPEENGSC